MAKNLKEALAKNRLAAEELDRVLRECLALARAPAGTVGEGRLRLVEGGRSRPGARVLRSG